MNKKIYFGTVLIGLLLSYSLHAEVFVHQLRRSAAAPETVAQLKNGMTQLEESYFKLKKMIQSQSIDYDAVKNKLKEMEKTGLNLVKANKNPELEKSLKKLVSQIKNLAQESEKKETSDLKQGLADLHNTCFRCHSTHVPLL